MNMASEKASAICRELRKLNEPKFNGEASQFTLWKKIFTSSIKGYGVGGYLESPHLEEQTVENGKEHELKETIEDHLAIMQTLRSVLIRLIPSFLAAQALALPGWTCKEALKKITFKDADKFKECKMNEELDSEAHVSVVFKFIRDQYEATTMAEKQALWNKLEALKLNGNDFEDLYSRLLNLVSELRGTGQAVSEDKQYAVLINALPKSALSMVATLQAQEKTFLEAVKMLRVYFKTQETWDTSNKVKEEQEPSETTVLQMQRRPIARTFSRKFCQQCGKSGHVKAQCWELHPELMSSRAPRFASPTTPRITCDFCGKLGHLERQCRIKSICEQRKMKNKQYNEQEQVKAARQENVEEDDEDINDISCVKIRQVKIVNFENQPQRSHIQLDSAADIHLSGIRESFIELSDLPETINIKGVNEDAPAMASKQAGIFVIPAVIDGKRTVVHLYDVKYVPTYQGTIISQGLLTQKGYDVITTGCKAATGEPGRVDIKKDGSVVLQGTQCVGSPRTYINVHMPSSKVLNSTIYATKTGSVCQSTDSETMDTWHRRLGHIAPLSINKTLDALGITPATTSLSNPCHSCLMGQAKHNNKAHLSQKIASEPLERVSVDLSGRVRYPSLGGAEYFGVFVDQATLFTRQAAVKRKSEFSEKIITFIKWGERITGRKLKHIRRDNAGEYHELEKYCQKEGVDEETTVPGNSFQNGLAEKIIGITQAHSRTSMIQANAPNGFWAEAVAYTIFTFNHTAHKRLNWEMPVELFTNDKPRVEFLHPFGCSAYALSEKANKLGKQAELCIYLGPAAGKKGYKVWNPTNHKAMYALHVKFVEHIFPWQEAQKRKKELMMKNESQSIDDEEEEPIVHAQIFEPQLPAEAPVQAEPLVPADDVDEDEKSDRQAQAAIQLPLPSQALVPPESVAANPQPQLRAPPAPESIIQGAPPAPEPIVQPPLATRPIRSNRGVPRSFHGDEHDWRVAALKSEKKTESIPTNHEEAMNSKDAPFWKAAEENEINSLIQHNTFVVVKADELPEGTNLLNGKWVYAEKLNENNEVIQYKARFVACGYAQTQFQDYFETKADVAETRTFRLVLAIAALRRMKLAQVDVSSAYLNGDLEETIYMKSPEGTADEIWKLKKPLYGLKQAGHNWRKHIDKSLKSLGLQSAYADPALYFSQEQGKLSLLAIHVDDMLLANDNQGLLSSFLERLSRIYTIKSTLEPTWLLHMQIKQDHKTGNITLSQEAYAKKCLEKFGMSPCTTTRVPLPPNTYLTHKSEECKEQDENEKLSKEEQDLYREIVGSLNYLATHTRPDLCISVGQLGKSMQGPTRTHLNLAKNTLRYLARTTDFAILFEGSNIEDQVQLIGFSDANFANEPDRRSIGANCFVLQSATANSVSNLISWSSKRLKHVATSTEEAELSAGSEAGKEAVALRSMLIQLKIINANAQITLFMDNNPAVTVANNPGYYNRLKHIDVRQKYLCQLVEEKKINVMWCPNQDMLADALTKPLPAPLLEKFTSLVFVHNTKKAQPRAQ